MEKEKLKWQNNKKYILIGIIISFILSSILFLLFKNIIKSSIFFVGVSSIIAIYFVMRVKLEKYKRIKKIEDVFPDFLQLISSNLRAGMTTDRAIILSARKEFSPLDEEINRLGKELLTGTKIEESFLNMGERINSEKIKKTISLIVTGIHSGGNIAVLLEETANSTRERNFVQKKASSNVLMYVIFIFAALMFGAPLLFGLSTVLVEVLTNILSGIPEIQSDVSLPFSLSGIDISTSFITYFSLIFMIVIGLIGSLVLGLVTKGEERDGFKYIIPIISVSIAIFFIVRIVLLKYFSDFFSLS
jgi:archaeal flagellar protein FlaJ